MQRVNPASVARFADDKMQKVVLFESPRFFCDIYCLKPGQAQRVHAHPDADKIYYVLNGRATMQVGEEQAEVEGGVAILAPAGADHGVSNRSDAPLTLLVFMAPRPSHG
jgi:mannose-6-phosphate isomerase-like protein (cupin superfamily)